MTIDQQVALDEALVPHASRLRNGKSNFLLRSDIMCKESTLQVVYDVLRLTLFYKAFLVTSDVHEIYMEMLHICLSIPNQAFDELSFQEEILAFLRYLGHSGEIKKITDKNVDFAYLLLEDFVYQVKHKDAKKSNEMYYPRFTKVIINFFMTKDPSIPRRNKVNWYYVGDDQMFTTIKLVSRHQNTSQLGAAPPKTKASVKKIKSSFDTTMPPPTAASIRLLTSAKGKQPAKSSKAKGLYVLYEVALTKAEHMKLATKRSLQQTHISQASRSSADEGTGIIPGVPDVPTYESDEEISWKSSDEDDDNDVDDQKDEDEQDDDDQDYNDDDQDLDNDGDDFVHPKLSTHDEEAKDEESFDPIVKTPSQVENSDDESNDDESHGMNVGGDKGPDAQDDDEELYRDVNINLEGRDIQMTDVYTTQVLKDTHVTLTPVNPNGQQQSSSLSSQFVTSMFNPSPDTGVYSLFESTPRVNVPVTTTVEHLLLTATTFPPPSIPTILQVQQAPAPSPTTAPSTFLQDLPNFGSLFGFDHRLKTLEANFFEFMQTNQFAKAVSSIPGIIDRYIDHHVNEAVKVAVQLQFDKHQDEAQDKNEDFLNKLDENIQKIIKEQVKEQVKTSYVVANDLSELELKKILIKKMERNKSIHRSDEQKNLYKALVDAYECDKIILDTYGDTVTLKRCHDDEDKDDEPFAGSDRGSKRRRASKEPESTSAPKEKASKTFSKSTEWSKSHQKTASESAPVEEPMQNTQATHGSIQPWISDLAKQANSRTSFNELMDTSVDFTASLMNRLQVDTLTPELLAGPTYELMKGSYKSLVELKFFLEEVYKATTDQLDWNNPEGQQYPHNLLKPLPLIPNSRGHRVIPFDHFINNDLEYLRSGASSRKYTTSGRKRQQFYGFEANRDSARDVYSKRRIIAVIKLQIVEWHNYKHLDWINVRRDDDKLYKLKEGNLKRLRIQYIEDMLLLLVQGKLTNLTVEERFAFNVSLRMFTRSIVI
uniref:Retrovirus-related Pol polyprotein from transposon TNT 1-94 n=1 Tax=Tanacetum cinerariifolium TaxID=118510 RepID=A0A699HCA1_TANCI|nr:hypothetical protein [Tanacetum cinerariifolium]